MKNKQFKLLGCRMCGVDAVLADTAQVFGRHTHDQFGVGLIDRGAQKSASGRGMVEAGAGDIITVNPGEVHMAPLNWSQRLFSLNWPPRIPSR